VEQTADAKDVLGRRSLDRRGKKEGRPEEKSKPLLVGGKRHWVVEERGPEEEEQGPE